MEDRFVAHQFQMYAISIMNPNRQWDIVENFILFACKNAQFL